MHEVFLNHKARLLGNVEVDYVWTCNIFNRFILKMSVNLSKFSLFNRGSTCTLYLLFVMTLIVLFCNLFSRPGLKTHVNIENWKCGNMRALCKILNMVIGRNFFSLFKTSIDLKTLFGTFWIWLFQFKCSSMVRPRKLNSVTRSTRCPLILISEIKWLTPRW